MAPEGESGCYHCYGRCVNKERWLGDEEAKDRFVAELRRVAAFCGVEVLTFCVMSNHYHILVRVDPKAKAVGDAELVRRFRALYGEDKCPYINLNAAEIAAVLKSKLKDAEEVRDHLRGRMGVLAGFMKTLKQRYSVWYNGERGRVGTLWAERYKSCVVQDSPHVLRVVGAYIELNPVRAGLAERAEDYRWSGYGLAVGAGVSPTLRAWSRSGIAGMLGAERGGAEEDKDVSRRYPAPPPSEAESGEAKRFIKSYGLLVRVKDDTGGGKGAASQRLEGALGCGERLPGLLGGAVVGTRRFVSGMAQRMGWKRGREPTVCHEIEGGEALCHARLPRAKPWQRGTSTIEE